MPGIEIVRTQWPRLLVAAILLAVSVWSLPLTLWEYDEPLFSSAVLDYEPLLHHPPPPGYPIYIGLAKAVGLLAGDPFRALTVLSIIGSIVAFFFFADAFGRLAGDRLTGTLAASLFYASPVMLVHANVAMSDPVALALLAATIWSGARLLELRNHPDGSAAWSRRAIVFAALASASCGCRPQFSIIVVPLFFAVLLFARRARAALVAIATFTIVSLVWLAPLVIETGGIAGFLKFETGQAGYLAAHDADVSRSGRTFVDVVLRFVAHPWGQKFSSFPLLALAGLGFAGLLLSRWMLVAPFVLAATFYLGFALAYMDPADGARYSIPSTLFVAFYAASGLVAVASRMRMRWSAAIAVAIVAAVSFAYVSSILLQRRSIPSPPAQAVAWIRANVPAGGRVLYELAMRPIADYTLADYRPVSVDRGLPEIATRPDVPAVILADGGNEDPAARTFQWSYSDAYGKITRAHYRVVSVVPLPVEDRFWPGPGVHAPERTVRGSSWRWLAPSAAFTLPDLGARTLFLSFDLPPSYPFDTNEVEVFVNGSFMARATLRRDAPVDLLIPVSAGKKQVRIRSARSFVPADVPESLNRDPRELAVMLLVVEQRHSHPARDRITR